MSCSVASSKQTYTSCSCAGKHLKTMKSGSESQRSTKSGGRCFTTSMSHSLQFCTMSLSLTQAPNPSIERTSQGLRPCAASHVKRDESHDSASFCQRSYSQDLARLRGPL